MIGFPSALRVHIDLEPHDKRKFYNWLAAIAADRVGRGQESGSIFVFTNKLRNRLKVPFFDRTGGFVLPKHLEEGTSSCPSPSGNGSTQLSLAPEALQLLIDGIDLRCAEMRQW